MIPDTQFYSQNDEDAPLFTEITEWLVASREAREIQLVLHVGDIVHLKDLTTAYRSDPNGEGHVPHQMLFNAQWAPRGGMGWLRLLEFQHDGRTVQVRTFSPHLAKAGNDPAQAWRWEPSCDFTFTLK